MSSEGRWLWPVVGLFRLHSSVVAMNRCTRWWQQQAERHQLRNKRQQQFLPSLPYPIRWGSRWWVSLCHKSNYNCRHIPTFCLLQAHSPQLLQYRTDSFFIMLSKNKCRGNLPCTSMRKLATSGEFSAGLRTRHCHCPSRSCRDRATWSRLMPVTAPLSSCVATTSSAATKTNCKVLLPSKGQCRLSTSIVNKDVETTTGSTVPSMMCDPFHHSMRGTGLPPPDRHNKVTIVPSLNGPMRDTFRMAADVFPSSSKIST